MANPTSGTTIQRPDLGAIAYEYMSEGPGRGFIGTSVMPIFEVPEKSADYPIIPIEAVLKAPADLRRNARGGYVRSDWEFETGTYSCQEYGLEEPIDDSEANLYQRYFDAEVVATEIATGHVMRAHEARVATALFTPANAVANVAVTTEWSTVTCTPKADVKTAIAAMRAASGVTPNSLVMSLKVFENVMISTEIRDYLQYTSPHLVQGFEAQRDVLARYLGIGQILVGGGQQDSAAKGQAFSLADLWDDEFVSLCRVSAGGMALREPVVGRTFMWTEDAPQELVTESYREERTRSDIVRVRQSVDEAFVFTGANYLLNNITA